MKSFYRYPFIFMALSLFALISCESNDIAQQHQANDAITPHSELNFDNWDIDLPGFTENGIEEIILIDNIFSTPNFQSDVESATGNFLKEMQSYMESLGGKYYTARFITSKNQLKVSYFEIYDADGNRLKRFIDVNCANCDILPFETGGSYSCPDGYYELAVYHSKEGVKKNVAAYLNKSSQAPGDDAGLLFHRSPSSIAICAKK